MAIFSEEVSFAESDELSLDDELPQAVMETAIAAARIAAKNFFVM
jgi:hypothetical protein